MFLMLNDGCNQNNDLWENDMSVTLDVAANLTKMWKDSPGNPTEVDLKVIFIDYSLHRPAAIRKRLLLSLNPTGRFRVLENDIDEVHFQNQIF